MRFLFATWDGGGNVLPTLAIARQLHGRGHSVRVLGPRSLRVRVEGAGCAFAAYTSVPDRASPGGAPVLGRARAALLVLELARAAPMRAFAEDVLSELERDPVDVFVVDFMLAGAIAGGERAGIPTAALMHTLYSLPAARRAPFGPALEPAAGPAGRLRDAAITALARRVNAGSLRDLNRTRGRIGLAPVASAYDQLLRVERLLVLTTTAFDPPPASLPATVRFVGPQLDGSSKPERLDLRSSTNDSEPLVIVSFSSRFAAQEVVQRVLDALDVLPVRVLLTFGPALAPDNLRVPASAVLRRFVPHERVLPGARLVVTHAGLGTVMAALAHGIPLLCIPLKNDQFENAARVVAAGAGRRLGAHVRRSSLVQAILQILNDPRFRDGAGRMAEAIAAHEGRAVQELEALSTPINALPSDSPQKVQ